jgi:hypothetical protein
MTDPTYEPVDWPVTVIALDGWDPNVVSDNVKRAIEQLIEQVVFPTEDQLIAAITLAPGVNYARRE